MAELVPMTRDRVRRSALGAEGNPLVIAHRGDHRDAMENSMAAFEAAIRSGFDMIETDLRRCLDGVVVCHDATAGGRPVSTMSRVEIRAATGVLPVLMDDLIEVCRGRIGLDLELKEPGFEADMLDAVTPYFGPSEYLVSSFDAEILGRVRDLSGDVRTGLLSGRSFTSRLSGPGVTGAARPVAEMMAVVADCGADLLIPDCLDAELISAAGDLGVEVILWYVNTPEQMRQALRLRSVAGVITDGPHRWRRLAARQTNDGPLDGGPQLGQETTS